MSRKQAFDDLIKGNDVVLIDGAMGTQLDVLDLPMSGEVNLTHPEQVRQIHKEYLDSGAQVLITNTLTMNRAYIKGHGLEIDVQEVNLSGAKLARSLGEDHYVLGDISSTGILLEPYGAMAEPDADKFLDAMVKEIDDHVSCKH